jgi:Amt family ammonium transporter
VLAGAVCAIAVGLKWRLGFDDSLDVVGVHLVGGAFGSISLGFLSLTGGLFYDGRDAALLGKQVVAVLTVGAYSFVLALVIALVIDKVIGFRITEDDEITGIDFAEHAETGYELHPSAGGGLRTPVPAGRPTKTPEESVQA